MKCNVISISINNILLLLISHNHVTVYLYWYMGWFFCFGTNASVLSCNNVGRCHFYRRLLTCIPSLRAHDLARPRHRSCAVVLVRWVVGSQRSRDTAGVVSALLNRWDWEVLYHPPLFSRHQSLRLWSHPENANAREVLPYHWRRKAGCRALSLHHQ